MKFSIVIPTQNRSRMLAVVVRHAMQPDHEHFEVIVSDNSTTEEQRQLNAQALSEYIGHSNFRIVYPPQILSAPEHFEFALNSATGDYVAFLTDKMVILPGLLPKVEAVIADTGAEIVNWAYAPYTIDDLDIPDGPGTLIEDNDLVKKQYEIFDPIEALKFKAGCTVPRNQQSTRDYALGKIIFGVYSKELIRRILAHSGTLFGGATHDYSAMIQALSMAGTCVMLNAYGVIFISLPMNKSLGSLTANDAQGALKYFEAFTEGDSIIANLLVPGLYASQHNMVAYDYKKFLPMYGHSEMFSVRNWLRAIYDDLYSKNRIWKNLDEKSLQVNFLSNYLKMNKLTVAPKKKENGISLLDRVCRKRDQVLQAIYPIHSDSWKPERFTNQKLERIDEAVQRLRLNKKGRTLIVYAANQTYTATVFEHLDAFRKYSESECNYINIDDFNKRNLDLMAFDAVIVHYSVRLPFGQLHKSAITKLQGYAGLKILFIQDEYDNTGLSKQTIGEIGFNLVYSVVPERSIEKIYPKNEFPATRFISCFTGYVPDSLAREVGLHNTPSKRQLKVAYRGRPLPVWYGKLGQEKIEIGQKVREYCQMHGISCDIAWEESARIYGEDWYKFISAAKSMLGSESGSNVFDWSGSLRQEIQQYCQKNPTASQADIYREVVERRETEGLMNQISPRIFEMAAAETVMILLEGEYSGVLKPNVHYIPLKKDFSNLDDVFKTLSDDRIVDDMAERTFKDIILSGSYSYRNFIKSVDTEIESAFRQTGIEPSLVNFRRPLAEVYITCVPMRAKPPLPRILSGKARFIGKILFPLWQKIPVEARPYIKKFMGRC